MAAAANVYYDTLTELNDDAKELMKHHFDPDRASQSMIVKIFSKQIPIEELKPPAGKRPVIIITAGSPGVGKSTIAKEQFNNFGIDPKKVYTVSMDTLLEHNRLFRNETKKLYHKWHNIKGDFTNSNYAKFSGISSAAYDAKQANLKIPEKVANVNRKYMENMEQVINNELIDTIKKLNISKPATVRKTTRKKSVAQSPPRPSVKSPSRSPSKSPPKTVRRSARLASKPAHSGGATDYDLNDIREIGFEFGVANGLNILYDCTLTKTGTRMASIMKILQKYSYLGPKYEIKILLIKADDNTDEAARLIKQRIRKRHHNMVENGYLRALTPSIGAIISMIISNKAGFDAAYRTYGEKIVNPPYEPSDFYFEEFLNPHRIM
jgi:hypothetical protein